MKTFRVAQRITSKESESFKKYLIEVSKIELFTPEEESECSIRASNGDKKAASELVRRNLRFVISVAKQYETTAVSLEDLVNEGNIGLIMAAEKYNVSTGFKFITYAVFWVRKMMTEYFAKHGRLVRIPSNKINNLSKFNKEINDLEQKLGRTVDTSEIFEELRKKMSAEEILELENLSTFNVESLDKSVNEESGSNLSELIADENIKSTDHLVVDSDLKTQIRSLLKTLKPRDRKIMVALYGLEDSAPIHLKEVGEMMGMTRERVRQIKEKSLLTLKKSYFKEV